MKITIRLKDPSLVKQLDALESKVKNLEPAMDEIGRYQKTQIQLGFRSSRSPYGASWAPLKLRDGKPLMDSRKLYGSISWKAHTHSVAIGTNAKQAKVQNFGATIYPREAPALMFSVGGVFYRLKKAVIPARPFLPTDGLPESWKPSHKKYLVDYLSSAT